MCFFRKKYGKKSARNQKREDPDIIAANVKVGDKFTRRWSEDHNGTVLFLRGEYTVTRIEGDLITLECPHEKPLQLPKELFAAGLRLEFSKV